MEDKAVAIMKLIRTMEELLNENEDFFKMNQNNEYSYLFRIVDDNGEDRTKFSVGVKNGVVSISPKYTPDVTIVMLEGAFFDIIFNRQTIEQCYFCGEADIHARKGDWTKHLVWIKSSLDILEEGIRKELNKKIQPI